jgi:hypothetical protein
MSVAEENALFAMDCYLDPMPDEDEDGDSSEYFASRGDLEERLNTLRAEGRFKYFALYEVDRDGDFELYDEVYMEAPAD